jgi:hypothetical protein
MAATILSSPRAAAMSVYIVRAFVRLRLMLETNTQLARKLDALEKSVAVMDADTKRQFKDLRAVVFALNIDIASRILILRGELVLLDQDLALLYGVTIKRLNQQVRRNLDKFPGDFLFQLEPGEADSLRMHFATLKKTRGGHRKHSKTIRSGARSDPGAHGFEAAKELKIACRLKPPTHGGEPRNRSQLS